MGRNYWHEKRISSKTDLEFISLLSHELGKSPQETKEIIKKAIECIRKCIYMNGYVNLRRLGRFYISARKNMKFINFKKKRITVPIIYSLRFKSSHSVRNMINKKEKEDRDKSRGK